MRILISLSYYYPNVSGLTIYASNLAKGLFKRRYEVDVITSRHTKSKYKEVLNGIRIKRIWTPLILGRGPIMPTYLWNSFLAVLRTDIVNCHLPQFEAVFPCFWAKLFGKKLIITYQCDLSPWPGLLNKIQINVTYMSNYFSCLLSDRIVVSSKDYADNSEFLQKFKKKLIAIPPPVKLAEPFPDFGSDWKDVKLKVGFVGRIAKEKGIKYLLDAIPFLRKSFGNNFKIFLAGPTEVLGGGVYKEIEIKLKKYKKYVLKLGLLKDEELAAFYKTIDVLVLPSTERMEAFGMVQVEAILSGCPVVTTDIPGPRTIVKETNAGILVKPFSGKEIANALIHIYNNKPNKNNFRKARRIYSFEKSIDQYEKLFG